jgi:hypothetical protein
LRVGRFGRAADGDEWSVNIEEEQGTRSAIGLECTIVVIMAKPVNGRSAEAGIVRKPLVGATTGTDDDPVTGRWETIEAIAAARRRFEAAIPGWQAPAAYGVARDTPDGPAFVRVNAGEYGLPAVVLASVCGHTSGSAAYRLSADDLARAVELLLPARACTEVEHPNLVGWQWLHANLAAGELAVAVFAATLAETGDDRYVAALVEAALAGRVENPDGTTTLWRPVGPAELELIRASGWRAFPPRLPDQPIFYPVLSEAYAVRIAQEWNVAASGAGYVTRFRAATSCARRYPSRVAGGEDLRELWVPAAELAEFNANLVGPIEVVAEFVDTGDQ